MIASLQVLASPRIAGAEMTFLRCVEGLRRTGHPTHVAVKQGSPLARAFESPGKPFELGLRNYADLLSVLAIRRIIRSQGCEVVQSWMSRGTWLTRAPAGCLHVARLGGYYRARYFRHADAWVTVTHKLRDWMLQEGFPAHRVETIPNFIPPLPAGTEPPFTREQLGIPADALVFSTMGRFIPKKGFHDLIRAFSGLAPSSHGRPLHLLLMGDGPQKRELLELAAPVQDRVHFTGWLAQPMAALPISDIFVCPSREEAHGNVMLEAWSQGLPVVATRSDGASELIEHGVNGWLCERADPESLREALKAVMESETLRQQLAGAGTEIFQRRHAESSVLAAYVDFYQRMRHH